MLEIPFEPANLVVEGHFVAPSGRHSMHKVECEPLLVNEERRARLAVHMVELIAHKAAALPDTVVGLGGLSNALAADIADVMKKEYNKNIANIRSIRSNKTDEGLVIPAQHAELESAHIAVVVGDVISTGGSAMQVIKKLRENKIWVPGAFALWNRGTAYCSPDASVEYKELHREELRDYAPKNCPIVSCRK